MDDIPKSVKLERLTRMVNVFRSEVTKLNRDQVNCDNVAADSSSI